MRHHGSKFDNVLPVMAIAIIGIVVYRMARAQKAKQAAMIPQVAPGGVVPSPVAGLGRFRYYEEV